MSQIIAIANQKGGVGKTTTAVNLATAYAAIGKKVLLLDLDPQGNASTGLGINLDQRTNNIYHSLLNGIDIIDTVVDTQVDGLDMICSTIDLAAAELEMFKLKKKEYVLKTLLKRLQKHYDHIVIDCPPSLGLLTINGLTAANSLIIPLQCEFYALEGLANLLNTIKLVQKSTNHNLKVQGILLTMVDRRNRLTQHVETEVREMFGELVYKTTIPRNIKLSEAPSHGKPAIIYDTRCLGSISYMHLVKEIIGKANDNIGANNERREATFR